MTIDALGVPRTSRWRAKSSISSAVTNDDGALRIRRWYRVPVSRLARCGAGYLPPPWFARYEPGYPARTRSLTCGRSLACRSLVHHPDAAPDSFVFYCARMYFVGIGIFFFVAILCVVAYFASRKRRRDYERGD
jgi:hypothetical protein